eukprot:GILK01005234.1.p1 GENE.GILK01005234.1~~GILK01005234.1.p1  ORF type:complete len:459 (-),score=65.62 GILK01005234.1:145-1350(-)
MEQPPRELNTTIHPHFVEVMKDKLTVKYIGKGNHAYDYGSVQTDKPAPTRHAIYYYEVHVVEVVLRNSIAVGFADANFCPTRQPGWEANSYGYRGDDGFKFHENSRGEPYGPPFGAGDVVGCGIHYGKGEVFFTKNGKYLGAAYPLGPGPYYPTVGLHSPAEVVTLNLGRTPFKFDVQALLQEEQEKELQQIRALSLAPQAVDAVIRDYLLHYGYTDTLRSMDRISGAESTQEMHQLSHRKALRELVMSGDIQSAIAKTNEWFPNVLQSNPTVLLQLHCQAFIQLISKGATAEAVEYCQTVLCQLAMQSESSQDNSGGVAKTIQEVIGLLAYEQPQTSPLQHLLTLSYREQVADKLNAAVLASLGAPKRSRLETLIRQLVAVKRLERKQRGNRGEVYTLTI